MSKPASDPVALLAALRPTSEDMERAWPVERRDDVLCRVLDRETAPIGDGTGAIRPVPSPHNRSTSRRRALIAAGGIAAAVAAFLVVPLVVPSGGPAGPPSAAALEQLANVAAAERPLQPGQFRHLTVTNTQNGRVTVMESWTSASGHTWRHDTSGAGSEFYSFPPGGDDINFPSPAFLAGLPTDPATLGEYLRTHVHGSTSRDEAVFVAVGDMLRGGFAPPALRAAALRVLEATAHVTAQRGHDSTGRPAVEVSFVDQRTRPDEVQTLYFDPDTARIVQERTTAPGLNFLSTVSSAGVVTSVPAQVLQRASGSGNTAGQGSAGCPAREDGKAVTGCPVGTSAVTPTK